MDIDINRVVMIATVRAMKSANDQSKKRFAEKHQVTKQEIIEAFDGPTFQFLIKKLNLRPIRQNGKNGKLYYNTKKVLDLVEEWHHL